MNETKPVQPHYEEIRAKYASGMRMLLLTLGLLVLGVIAFISGITFMESGTNTVAGGFLLAFGILTFMVCPFLFAGLKVLKPNEALVLTLFGKYYGTLKGPGFFFVITFAVAFNPTASASPMAAHIMEATTEEKKTSRDNLKIVDKKISLKSLTLSNEKQKINDELGNPIIIGIVVIWRVVNTAKAVFNVDNYREYLSIQCDSALRDVVRTYPYDISNLSCESDDLKNEKSLRGSSQEVAQKLKEDIQSRVDIAGLEVLEARITHLAYAPEIAAAMLQRQQASAIIDARQMIVEGAVGMVEMALNKLNENEIVVLDEERKAAMVSNLLVVLCGNKDAQPIVNSGSLY